LGLTVATAHLAMLAFCQETSVVA